MQELVLGGEREAGGWALSRVQGSALAESLGQSFPEAEDLMHSECW